MADRHNDAPVYTEADMSKDEAVYDEVKKDDQGAHDVYPDAVVEADVLHGAYAEFDREEQAPYRSDGCMGKVKGFIGNIIPYGGLASNCFSLASVTLGGGILSMPRAFHTSGMIMATIYLVVMTTLTIYSHYMVLVVMKKTGCTTLEQLGRLFFGPAGGYFVGFVLWLSCTGIAIAYVSAVDSIVEPICLNSPNTPAFLLTRNGRRCLQVLVWAVFMVPVVIPKHVNSIRYVSTVGVCFVLYFVVCAIVHSGMNGIQLGYRDGMALFTTGNKAIYGLSIFIFSFVNHGVLGNLLKECKPRPSVKWMMIASGISMGTCCFFYALSGFFGYFDFAADVRSPVLYNYNPIKDPYLLVSSLGMLTKICAAFAMNSIPMRNFVYYCVRWDLETVAYWKHFLVVFTMAAIVLICGLFIPSINLAFGLVGSLCGGFIAFLFPGLFWMYAGDWSFRKVGFIHYFGTYFLLTGGVIAIVFGTIATIYENFFE